MDGDAATDEHNLPWLCSLKEIMPDECILPFISEKLLRLTTHFLLLYLLKKCVKTWPTSF